MHKLRWCVVVMSIALAGCEPVSSPDATLPAEASAPPDPTTATHDETLRRGRFTYFADAAMFEDCATGLRHPVAMEGAYIDLEYAYLNSGIEPGSPLVVELEGRYLERPSMEDNRSIISLIVDSFIAVSHKEECAPTVHAPVQNTYWKLSRVAGRPVFPAPGQREAHMILSLDGSEVRGHAGCNRFFGRYELEGERLSFAGLAITEMACDQGMETEAAFMKALESSDRYVIGGQVLRLYQDDTLLATLEAVHLP